MFLYLFSFKYIFKYDIYDTREIKSKIKEFIL